MAEPERVAEWWDGEHAIVEYECPECSYAFRVRGLHVPPACCPWDPKHE